jgi:type I restriction enzyme S subunit
MSKEKKNIPELRFPEFEGDGDWVEKAIEDIAQVTTGNKDTQDKVEEGKYPFFVRSQTIERINSFSFDGEAILTSGDGVGVGKIYHYIIGKFDFHQRVYCIYHFEGHVEGKFVFYFFSEHFYNRVMQLSAKNSVDSVRRAMVTEMPIYLPNITEQQKIAACLSSLDDLITAHNDKLEALKDHKKGLMQNLFPQEGEKAPKYRFPEFEEDGEWVERKLGELLEFKNGINASKEQYGKGIKFINVLDILQNDFITYEKIIGSVDVSNEIVDKFSVNYGDILFQRSSETQEEVGTANVYLDREQTATFGGFVIRGKKIGEYEPIFLNKLLKSRPIRNSISSKSGGSTRFNIGQQILSSIKIFLPSSREQEKIAACLSALDDLITTQAEKIEQLQQHKKGLMQGLFPKV